jgi:phenylpyruvate tautomerase PptA (4-oxalocrotonate tautomerase family)/quinol monooxygenase YgiN
MPLVTVQIFPGRSTLMKELMARAIVDSVAEAGGVPHESVQVLFEDISPADWAIGPRLAASRETPPPLPDPPAHVAIRHIGCAAGDRAAYLAWRRDVLLPYIGTREGFVSAVLLTSAEDADRYVLIEKWLSASARQEYLASARGAELVAAERGFVEEPAAGAAAGDVVDVLRAP